MDNRRISYEGQEVFVGIDVHRHSYSVTAICSGMVVKKWTMEANSRKLVEQLKNNFCGARLKSVYETGFSGFNLDRELRAAGIENVVVHAGAVELCQNRVKTDKRDSRKLAEQLASGRLYGVRVPTSEEENRRQLTRTREQLVQIRTKIMNQVRMRLHYLGLPIPEKSQVLTKKFIASILARDLPTEVKESLSSQLRLWQNTEAELFAIRKLLKNQSATDPCEAVYRSIPGIGEFGSRILSNELGDLSQFPNERALFSFTGLTPKEHSSGDTRHLGHISRYGNAVLRKVLVEAAWQAVRRDPKFKSYFEQLSQRTGKKRAIVATARKLIGIARSLFKNNKLYELNFSPS